MDRYLNDEPEEACLTCGHRREDGRCSSPGYFGAMADGMCEPEDRKAKVMDPVSRAFASCLKKMQQEV